MKNMKKINEWRLDLCVLILSVTIFLLVPLDTVKSSTETESYCHTCFQSNVPSLSQNNYTIPIVSVREVLFPETLLEEGKLINLTVIIENKDDVSLSGFRLIIVLTEITNGRGEEPATRTVNKSLKMIPAISNVTDHISFTINFGEYILTACLAYGDIIVPKSSCSTQVHILGPPIGDVPTLLFALGGIFDFMVFAILIPGIVDQIRFLSRKKPHKERGRIISNFLKIGQKW